MKREPVKSSNLASVGYDASAKILDIEFTSGKVYRYFAVPEDIYSQLMKGDSAGKFFASKIMNVYESNEIGDKSLVIRNLTDNQKKELLAHFNSIYECKRLGEHEYKIIFLAWLWANGFVVRSESGMRTFDAGEAGVPITDYEITIEDDLTGGINLDLIRMYYDLDKMITLMKWK